MVLHVKGEKYGGERGRERERMKRTREVNKQVN
jgi:hypothetical protein